MFDTPRSVLHLADLIDLSEWNQNCLPYDPANSTYIYTIFIIFYRHSYFVLLQDNKKSFILHMAHILVCIHPLVGTALMSVKKALLF